MRSHPDGLAGRHPNLARPPQRWSQPLIFKLDDSHEESAVEDLIRQGDVAHLYDPVRNIAESLFDYLHPADTGDIHKRAEFIDHVLSQGDAFGCWVYFPWACELVRYPDHDDHLRLRTSRNRNLDTLEQQLSLYQKTILSLGLSVGSKAAMSLVEGGIGNEFILADGDTIEPTNLNRLSASFADIGSAKVDWLAKHISRTDPWIKQHHLPKGARPDDFLSLDGKKIDLIVEEVDDMQAKAQARLFAARGRIPLVMAADVDDKSIVDVERHDLRDRRNITFLGRIRPEDTETMARGTVSADQKDRLMLRHTGIKHVSVPMLRSVMRRGIELGGLPQRGSTATRGSADITYVARQIFLGRPLATGRYVDDPRITFGQPRQFGSRERLATMNDVRKYMKAQRDTAAANAAAASAVAASAVAASTNSSAAESEGS